MDTLVNSADQDEMPHKLAPHQGPHCLLGQKLEPQRKIVVYSLCENGKR